MYKNIEELLNANDPPEDDIYEVLTLKVSNYFYKKYNNNILINNSNNDNNLILHSIEDEEKGIEIKKNGNKNHRENNNIDLDYSFDDEIENMPLNKNEVQNSFWKNNIEKVEKEKKFELDIKKVNHLDFQTMNTHTIDLITFMMNLFNKIDLVNENLFKKILRKYSISVSEKLKNSNPEYFNQGINFLKSLESYKGKNPDFYFELSFEDFLLIFCSIIKYYTNLDIKLKFETITNGIDIYIYGNEEKYSYLAQKLQYELQLKPYAYKYELCRRDKKKLNDSLLISRTQNSINIEELIYKENNNDFYYDNIQFENLNYKSSLSFPPYIPYNSEYEIKYRRYEKNDLYHQCPNDKQNYDEICENCSKFRNIDKLLLINYSLEKLINFEFFKRQDVLINRIHKRNYLSYGKSIDVENLQSKTRIFFNDKNIKYLINLIRNYHGEKVAFYFLYLNHYLIWLICPSIIGIIFFFLNGENRIIKTLPLIYEHLYRLGYCIMITFWSTLFIKGWQQKENFYSYLWGTENFKHKDVQHETFKPDFQKYFMLGEKILFSTRLKRIFKRLFSYLILLIMGTLTITCSCKILIKKQAYLNDKKDKFEKKDIDIYFAQFSSYEIFITAIFAAINAITIKIFGLFYKILAKILNEWENYEKEYEATRDKIIKLIIFEFINNYTGGFFIAFVKPNLKDESKCAGGSCVTELSTLVYVLIFIEFLTVWFDYGVPKVLNWIKQYQIKKSNPNLNLDFPIQSLEHQKIITECDPMLYEYNKILVLFGYICLFSASAPLTPIGILFVVWLYSQTDLSKKFKLEKVNIIEKSKGIEIYLTLMKSLMFVGLVVNSGIILFSEKFNTGEEWFWKVLGLLILENLIIIVYFLINFNILPNWFSRLNYVKQLYDAKYYFRNENELPHLRFIKN